MSSPPDDRSLEWLDRGFWRMPNGQRRLLTWNYGSGELLLLSLDPARKDHMVLAVISSEEEVVRRLHGYEDHNDTPEGLAWLAQQLEGCR